MEIINPQQDVPVSERTYMEIKTATNTDTELQQVAKFITQGWPSKISEVPDTVSQYFTYRDELAVLDGIVYKGSRLTIPVSHRPEILKKLHVSHQGAAATTRRARSSVFWPNMSNDIRVHIEQCVVCALDAPLQQKETMQSHDIPGKVWNKVGMDLLTYKDRDYLIVVDYFSDYFECEHLRNTEAPTVINACKKTFARYGIPEQVQSDNGPQFTSSQFAQFSKTWGFNHTSSSPGHPKSNGKAEAAVKIVKRLMKRAKDPYLALLEYRNTPTAGMTTSPIERLLQRETRSILPIGTDNKKSVPITQVLKEKAAKKVTSQKSYNKSAADLKPLRIGSPVLVRDFNSVKQKWRAGKVIEQLSDRSYAILNDHSGNIVRRNRVDVRSMESAQPEAGGSNITPGETNGDGRENVPGVTNDVPVVAAEVPEIADPIPVAANPVPVVRSDVPIADNPVARSSRAKRMPTRYNDYVLY